MSLLDYERQFSRLKMNSRGGSEKSPHKVAMLLAVSELVENGSVVENKIPFDQRLKDSFSRHFSEFAGPHDRDNPNLPYFHLRSSGFWHHRVKPGRADAYAELTTAGGPGTIEKNIDFVFIDEELFELLGYGVARELLHAALLRNLTQHDRSELLDVGNGWDWLECEAIVQDYFSMLSLELAGKSYTKSEHRRNLKPKLKNRSDGSIEFKHQNISAVLLEMGQPYIQGYKPAFNYQSQLKQVVLAHIAGNESELDYILDSALVEIPELSGQIDWNNVIDSEIPQKIASIHEPQRKYLARKTNFTERERSNRMLGERGEAFVIEYERYRLNRCDRPDLASEVEWSSSEYGDGLGYDVRSFDAERDQELFIEVKTTNSGKYQPFFISDNELEFSRERSKQYSLYRVFGFRHQARIYELKGAVDQHVHLQPKSFRASFS
jgi:Protein NO VEIN, C-terminal